MKQKIAVIAAVLSMSAPVCAEELVCLNGRPIGCYAVIEDGKMFLPIDDAAKALGVQIIENSDTAVILKNKNGSIQTNAKKINGEMFVPIREAAEASGAGLEWNPILKSANIVRTDNITYEEQIYEKTVDDNGKPLVSVISAYPVFKGKDTAVIEKINKDIRDTAEKEANSKYSEYLSEKDDFAVILSDMSLETFYDDTDYETETLDDDIISVCFKNVSYLGGAHPNTHITCATYSLETGERLGAEYFIENPLERVKDWIKEQAKDPESGVFEDAYEYVNELEFYIKNGKIVFVFSPYDIAPYAAGVKEYEINLQQIYEFTV